jgi:N-acetylglutamate synthase-like GNAT family acetyltransferase
MGAERHARRARAEDAEPIRDLVRSAYEKYVPLIGREPKPMRADHARAIREAIVWVLEDGRGLSAVLELEAHEDHLLVENVAVRPDCQGQGLGRRLLGLAEDEARRLRLIELRLYTNERYVSNIALYERLGYHQTHRQPLAGSETSLVFMQKRLGVEP